MNLCASNFVSRLVISNYLGCYEYPVHIQYICYMYWAKMVLILLWNVDGELWNNGYFYKKASKFLSNTFKLKQSCLKLNK